jgi:hypothetical protein
MMNLNKTSPGRRSPMITKKMHEPKDVKKVEPMKTTQPAKEEPKNVRHFEKAAEVKKDVKVLK